MKATDRTPPCNLRTVTPPFNRGDAFLILGITLLFGSAPTLAIVAVWQGYAYIVGSAIVAISGIAIGVLGADLSLRIDAAWRRATK